MMMNSRAPIAGTTFCGDGGGWAGAFCAGAGMMRWAAPGGPTAAGLERSRCLQPSCLVLRAAEPPSSLHPVQAWDVNKLLPQDQPASPQR